MNKVLVKKELFRFVIAGVAAVGTDMTIYYLLIGALTTNWAKGISFLTGTFVAYLINKFWTFEQKKRSYKEAIRFLLLYFFTLVVNVSINRTVLYLEPSYIFLAFLTATGCSAILNFIGQKFWVFK